MVEFGKTLAQSKRPEWSDRYLNYERLKQILKKYKSPSQPVRSTSLHQLATPTPPQQPQSIALEFPSALEQELEGVVLFVLQEQGILAGKLQDLAQQRQHARQVLWYLLQPQTSTNNNDNSNNTNQEALVQWNVTLAETHQRYHQLAQELLQVIAFWELNVIAVRKILKKHDKQVPKAQQLGPHYYRQMQQHQQTVLQGKTRTTTHLEQLYHYGGLATLVASLQLAFEELHQMEVYQIHALPVTEPTPHHHRRTHSEPTSVVMAPPSTTFPLALPPGRTQTALTQAREPILDFIDEARSRLYESSKYVQVIAAQALIDSGGEEEDFQAFQKRQQQETAKLARYQHHRRRSSSTLGFQTPLLEEEEEPLKEEEVAPPTLRTQARTRRQQVSSLLNLASTFLYMTNYYIVAPTTGQYAIRLGSTEAMAGIIIGMTPNAALIATVLYGWWSNHSYKSALIFAATSSWLGNIAYASALYYDSLTLVLVGRFLNGFGSARSINRRYIADTFSRAQRTAASADFVTAGALGMAAGPAIAAILGLVVPRQRMDGPTLDDDPDQASLLWTVETSPGWIMLLLWSSYLVLAILYFEEPDRSHLYKEKTIETKETQGELQPLMMKAWNDMDHSKVYNATTDQDQAEISIVMEVPIQGSSMSLPSKHVEKKQPPLYRNIPVMMTLWLYFVLKLVLECLLSSCATLTTFYFGWDTEHSGSFLAFLGLLMFPANMVVARLSHRFEDRELLWATLFLMFGSIAGFLSYWPGHYTVYQYIFFGICVFLSTNVLEGPNMSLLSKTIPKNWAKGTFNSGFLATEAGTAARSVGDVLISAAFVLTGSENLLDATFVPLLVMVGISIVLMRRFFHKMMEDDEDDDTASGTQPGSSDEAE